MTTPSSKLDAATTKQPRKSKQFWAFDDFYNVVHVTGYECPPNGDLWWVPELGYSLSEKHHLFKTADKARAAAIKKLQSNIGDLQTALDRLRLDSQ